MRLAVLLAPCLALTVFTFPKTHHQSAIDAPVQAQWRTLDLNQALPAPPIADAADAIARAERWRETIQVLWEFPAWGDGKVQALPLADGSLLVLTDPDEINALLLRPDGSLHSLMLSIEGRDACERALAATDAAPAWGWGIVDAARSTTRLAQARRASAVPVVFGIEREISPPSAAHKTDGTWEVRATTKRSESGASGWSIGLAADGTLTANGEWRACGGVRRLIARRGCGSTTPVEPVANN